MSMDDSKPNDPVNVVFPEPPRGVPHVAPPSSTPERLAGKITIGLNEAIRFVRGEETGARVDRVHHSTLLRSGTSVLTGTMWYHFELPSAPRTKKNHGTVVMRGRRKYHIPSEPFSEWQTYCIAHVLENPVLALGLELSVNCQATFYRDRLSGDAVGYYQGLADVLQKCGVVRDDKLITQWDASRLDKDAANPRTVVTLTVLSPAEAR